MLLDSAPPVVRRAELDLARGLAVLLMFLDHGAALVLAHDLAGDTATSVLWALRMGPGRLSMPLFMVVSGVLLATRPAGTARVTKLIGAGILCSVAVVASGLWIAVPDILLTLGLVLAFAQRQIRFRPELAVILGVLQTIAWPAWGDAYQPGTIVAMLAAGVLLERHYGAVPALLGRVPDARPLAWLGRHALGVYVVHIVALSGLSFGLIVAAGLVSAS